MIDQELKQQILDSIASTGSLTEEVFNVNTNLNHVLIFSSGSARIQTTCLRHAKMILSQPHELKTLSNLQIRCVLCSRVISYPAWYYSIRYAVNQFHYFICFDKDCASKPNTKCYKRSV